MFQMAHRTPRSNIISPEQSSSIIPSNPTAIAITSAISSRDKLSAQNENIIRKEELERLREAFQANSSQWNDARKRFSLQNLPPDTQKLEWMTRIEQEKEYHTRKQMEDPYYRANQEYLRLMNENQNRQSFREKQRLTEDLEKQKRLLIEDLARDQQLLQDKFKRNSNLAYNIENRHKTYRPDFPPVRNEKEPMHIFSAHPFAQTRNELHHFHAQRNDMVRFPRPIGVNHLNQHNEFDPMKFQCKHSDLTHPQTSLLPLIEEKERKIQEMEKKIIMLTQSKKFENEMSSNTMRPARTLEENNENMKKECLSKTSPEGNKLSSPASPVDNLIIDVTENTEEKLSQEIEVDKNQNRLSETKKESLEGETVSNDGIHPQTKIETNPEGWKKNPLIESTDAENRDDVIKPIEMANESESNDAIKNQKKKPKQRSTSKSVGSDFQTSQSRLALDLPNHNWLVGKLVQENKLGANDVAAKTPVSTNSNNVSTHNNNNNFSTNKKEENALKELIESKEESKNEKITNCSANNMESNTLDIKILSVMSLNNSQKNVQTVDINHNFVESTTNLMNSDHKVGERKMQTENEQQTIRIDQEHCVNNKKSFNKGSDLDNSLLLKMLDPKNNKKQSQNANQSIPKSSPETTEKEEHMQTSCTPSKTNVNLPPTLIKDNAVTTLKNETVDSYNTIEGKNNADKKLSNTVYPPASVEQKRQYFVQSASAPPATAVPKFMEWPETSHHKMNYQDLRPNLVVMTRRESDKQMYSFSNPLPYNPNTEAENYRRFIIEERYNRKRPYEDEVKKQNGITLNVDWEKHAKIGRLDFASYDNLPASERSKLAAEVHYRDELRRKELALHDLRHVFERRSAPLETKSFYRSHPLNPADMLDTKTDILRSPSAFVNPRLADRDIKKEVHMRERNPLDHKYKNHSLENEVYLREREQRLIEEERLKEKLAYASKYPNLMMMHPKEVLSAANNNYLVEINERVRTVEDLRQFQMAVPISNSYDKRSRQTVMFRNGRLTEREQEALWAAERTSQISMKKETIPHNPQGFYYDQGRLESKIREKPLPLPHPLTTPSHIRNEELNLAEVKKKEEKMRLLNRLSDEEEREALLLRSGLKPLTGNHLEHNEPRFYSHKIPRTRNGSLDFGRSKPVEYNFLDCSTSVPHDSLPSEGLNRPSSLMAEESWGKLPRRPLSHTYMSSELYKRLTHGGNRDIDSHVPEKWKMPGMNEKRCKICNKDAQYLCSGCRKAWYCSQQCQLSEWKFHSKTCSLER